MRKVWEKKPISNVGRLAINNQLQKAFWYIYASWNGEKNFTNHALWTDSRCEALQWIFTYGFRVRLACCLLYIFFRLLYHEQGDMSKVTEI